MVGSPFAGWACNKIGPKIPLIILLLLFSLSSLWYALATTGWELIVTRFLIGFADGNITICRTFVAQATTTSERSKYVSRLGACQGVGFTMGFVIGGLISPINLFPNSRFSINVYTAPGYLSFIIGIINTLLVGFLFIPFGEPDDAQNTHSLVGKGGKDESGSNDEKKGLLGHDDINGDFFEKKEESLPMKSKLGIGLCIVTWFILITAFSLFETIQTPYLHDNYGWSPFEIGLAGAFGGIMIIFEAILMPKLCARFGEKAIMIGGFASCTVGLVLLAYPWSPNAPPPSYFMILLYLFFFGYGFAQLSELVLYSKILGNLPQGVYMGYLTSSGSLARIIGPLWAVSLYNLNHNGTPMFLAVGGVMFVGTLLGFGIPVPP